MAIDERVMQLCRDCDALTTVALRQGMDIGDILWCLAVSTANVLCLHTLHSGDLPEDMLLTHRWYSGMLWKETQAMVRDHDSQTPEQGESEIPLL
jgi:hypothetical protein